MNHLGRMKKSTGLENTPQTNLQSYWKHNGMSTGAACPLGDFQVKWLEIILQPSREGAVKRKNSLLDPSAAAAAAAAAKSLQSCPTLCNPIDGSPPGPAVPGILQARTLEWVAVAFSPGSIYEIIKQKLREALGRLEMLMEKPMQWLLICMAPLPQEARTGAPCLFLVTQLAGHRGLVWEGMGYPQLSELWKPVDCGHPAHPGQPFQHAWCFQEVPSISHSCSCENWIVWKYQCCWDSTSFGFVKHVDLRGKKFLINLPRFTIF